jgi:hypothetical protein
MSVADRKQIRRRIQLLEQELASLGDDAGASRAASIAGLRATVGDREEAASMYLAAAKHCRTTGHLLRAAVLARVAYRTLPAAQALHDSAVGIWRECSGEPDSEFYATGSAN